MPDKDSVHRTSLIAQPSSGHNAAEHPVQDKSLAWVQLHDEAPASFGVDSWNGYVEMIPAKARLPYTNTTTFMNALDYCYYQEFIILYRHSMLDAPMKLDGVLLTGLRVAREDITRVKATMSMGKDLIGRFDAYDTWTKSAASIMFDGGAALRASITHGLLPKGN